MANLAPGSPTLNTSDLFYEELINSYVQAPHFVPRSWLADQVQAALDKPGCRFVLLTAGPGTGKSSFMAWLASQHPGWPRYFIRRDSQTPISSGDARSFLFSMGHQLAVLHPELFHLEGLEIVVRQRLGEVAETGQATGVSVENLSISPFRKTALLVEQKAQVVAGDLIGLSVKNMTVEKRTLEVADLQYLALLDPAAVLARQIPQEHMVILVDALDELRFRSGTENLLDWLSICPKLPANVRLVLTSRPDDELLERFRRAQSPWLSELSIDPGSSQSQNDLRLYASRYITHEPLRAAFQARDLDPQKFIEVALSRAAGSFQYLAALFRGIDQALTTGAQDRLLNLLSLEEIPADLGELYAYFISLVREGAAGEKIEAIGSDPFNPEYLPAWQGVYQPILGSLSVARQPLFSGQIQNFGRIRAEARWGEEALGRLGQFLARESRRYRLFHPTFGEYLTSEQTRQQHPLDYLAPAEWHFKIAAFFRAGAASWEDVDWAHTDEYGLLHLPWHLQFASSQASYRPALHELVQTDAYHQTCLKRFGDPWLSLDGLRMALLVALEYNEVADAWLHTRRYSRILASSRELDVLFLDVEEGRLDQALRRSALYADRPYWQAALRLWLAWTAAAGGEYELAEAAARQACRSDTPGGTPAGLEDSGLDVEYYLGEVTGFTWGRLLRRVAGEISPDPAAQQAWNIQVGGSVFENIPSFDPFTGSQDNEGQLASLIGELKARNREYLPRSVREASYRYRNELARGLAGTRHSAHWQEYVRDAAGLIGLDHYASYRELALAWILAAVLIHEDAAQARLAMRPILAAALEGIEPVFGGDALTSALCLAAARQGRTLDEATIDRALEGAQGTEQSNIDLSSASEGFRRDPWAHQVRRQSALSAVIYRLGQTDRAKKLLAEAEPLTGTYGAYRVQARLSLACRWIEFGELEQAGLQLEQAEEDAGRMKSQVLKTTWTSLVERARPWFQGPPDALQSEEDLLQRARSYTGLDRFLYLQALSAWWAGQPSRLKRLLPLALEDPITSDAVLGRLYRALDPAVIPADQVERLAGQAAGPGFGVGE